MTFPNKILEGGGIEKFSTHVIRGDYAYVFDRVRPQKKRKTFNRRTLPFSKRNNLSREKLKRFG